MNDAFLLKYFKLFSSFQESQLKFLNNLHVEVAPQKRK